MQNNGWVSYGVPLLIILSSFSLSTRYRDWFFRTLGLYRYLVLVPVLIAFIVITGVSLPVLVPLVTILSVVALFLDWRTFKRYRK